MKDNELREKVRNDLDSLVEFKEEKKDEESEKEKTLRILLDTKDINLKTELNDKEILELSKLEVISERIDSTSLALFISRFKELRVSKNRQGRKEIVGAIQDDETKREQGFFSQFMTDLVGKRPN